MRRLRRRTAAGALCALAALASAVTGCTAAASSAPPPATPPATPPAPPPVHGEDRSTDGEPRVSEAADPARVRIPVISVDAPAVPLDLGPDRVLPPPSAPAATGWWRGGPEPGEPGPAVIVGHLDSRTGPAVFHRLSALRPGDRVLVDRRDGSTAVFTATRLERVPRDDFPTARVYGATGSPVLRLITCAGRYDRTAGHYEQNLIVYAALTDTVLWNTRRHASAR